MRCYVLLSTVHTSSGLHRLMQYFATERSLMTKLRLMLGCAIVLLLPGFASADIVYNGGFEIDDFTGWILSGNPIPGTVDMSNPHSGSYAANLFAAGYLGYIEQFLTTTP